MDVDLMDFSIEDFRAGDEGMMEKVFYAFSELLYHRSLTIVNDTNSAEDVVAKCMFKLWVHRKKIRSPGHLRAFLLAATKNASIDIIRRKASNPIIYSEDPGFLSEGKQDNDDMAELDHPSILDLVDALKTLPKKQKEIVQLTLEGNTIKQIASLMGTAESTARNQLNSAIDKLRKILL